MKRIIFLLITSFTFVVSQAQVSINFNVIGPSTVELRFSDIHYWVEYQCDTTSNFNSHYLRTKISKGSWTDTITKLKLGRVYSFRSRHVRSDGTIMSDWKGVTYFTATYPLNQYFSSGLYVNYVNIPIHKFIFPYFNQMDLWYDITPNFNSPYLTKVSRSNDFTQILIPMYGPYDTLYVRSRVSDVYDSLPWKTVMLIKDFKPNYTLTSRNPCNDSTKFRVELQCNFYSSFTNYDWKTYIKYGNTIDSVNTNFFNKPIDLVDNSSITIITNTQFYDDTFSGYMNDTTIVDDPLKLNQALQYVISTTTSTTISFINYDCNTGIELEHHTDTNYINKISTQYKNNKTSFSQIQFVTNWSQFTGTALRYRIIRCGIKGKWFNIPPGNYVPVISKPMQIGIDTTQSQWTIYRSNFISGKNIEIEHDINVNFNSPKKRTYLISDKQNFNLESLFGNFNFVRCRLVDGPFKSAWSNVVSKQFTNGGVNKSNNNFTQPIWSCIITVPYFSGMHMRFGHSSSAMKTFIPKPSQFPDTFDFVEGDTVFYQLRRFTSIDTSNWSGVLKDVYKGNSSFCFIPWITYNGYQNGKDTFYLKWKDKNPSYTSGFKLYIGPSKLNFKGEIDIPKSQSSFLIDRKKYPANWYFALYPACSMYKNYTTLVPEWYSFNGWGTSLNSTEITEIYYSTESQTIFNNSDRVYSIKIYNNIGQLIQFTDVQPNSIYTFNDFPSGVYHLQFNNYFNYFQESILIQ